MRSREELLKAIDVALEEDDWCDIEDIVLETLHHYPDFADEEYQSWNGNVIKEICQEVGDKVYEKWGVRELKNIRLTVECVMGEYAARFLDIFWSRYLGIKF